MEAGAYVRRKQRIVFSPNCIEKMANFTSYMNPPLTTRDDFYADDATVVNEDTDYNDTLDKETLGDDDHQPLQHDKDNNCKTLDYIRNLPPYTDFSFTAQYPRINFSRSVVREFSKTYGQYVKKLEIFFPNDGSLTAKDFRQFFLQGMPNVQYIHFVNLPTKLTQSSFLRRTNVDTIACNTQIGSPHFSVKSSTDFGNSSSRHEDVSTNNISSSDTNGRNMIQNNNNDDYNQEKDTNCNNTKDNKGGGHGHGQVLIDDAGKLLLVVEKAQHKQPHQDCLLKWEHLTHLKIDRTLLIEVAWSKSFLQDLFSTMPNLRHYELFTWNTTGGDGHSNPYFTCLTKRQRENLVSLYPGSVGTTLLTSLADYGLKSLKKLHLPVFSGEVSAQSVEHLLINLKGTLQELQVNCSSMQDSRMIHFPRMEKLLSLHMIISVPWKNVYTLFTPSIEYQSQFPVLETLKLELAVYHDFGFIHYFFPNSTGSVCRTLRELDISFSGYRDEKFIGIVAKIFPNLAKLRLDGYGNRILASICLYLQNLEYFEMYLIYGFNVDDQLTGIDRKICNEMRKCENYLDFKADHAQVLPSLSNLSSK